MHLAVPSLKFQEPMEELRHRFRAVTATFAGAARLPDKTPPRWLMVKADGRNLTFVGHVAGHAEHLVPVGAQSFRCRVERLFVVGDEDDGGAGLGERLRCREPHAGAGAGDKSDLAVEVVGGIHQRSPIGGQVRVKTGNALDSP